MRKCSLTDEAYESRVDLGSEPTQPRKFQLHPELSADEARWRNDG